MAYAKCDDATFIKLFEQHGAEITAKKVGCIVRAAYMRREKLEKKYRRQIVNPNRTGLNVRTGIQHSGRIETELQDGICLVGSDCHYWPGPASLMHRAFVRFCKDLKPRLVILNGDVIDACSISRYPPIGWEKQPTVQEEVEAAQDRLSEIDLAAKNARKIWTLGNHDARFETRLATVAPQYARLKGTHLRDHFPLWEPSWSVFINSDVVVKHRFKGGIHSSRNNTLNSGRTMITGHLHSAKIAPLTDYNGDRYGVDTGCIADPDHRAFVDYTEDSPKDWRPGFCILTFKDGRLLPPELVHRWTDDSVVFRGEVTSC